MGLGSVWKSAMDEIYALPDVRGNGGFLRHTDDGVAGATSDWRPRGDQSTCPQTGAKRDTVEHRQPAREKSLSRGKITNQAMEVEIRRLQSSRNLQSRKGGHAKMYNERCRDCGSRWQRMPIATSSSPVPLDNNRIAHTSAGKKTVEIVRPTRHGGMNMQA